MTCVVNLEPILRIIIDAATAVPPPLSPSQVNAYIDAIQAARRVCSASDPASDILTNPSDEYSSSDVETILDDFSESDVRAMISEFEASGFYSPSNSAALNAAIDAFLDPGVVPARSSNCAEDDLDANLLAFTNLVASIYRNARARADDLLTDVSVSDLATDLDTEARSALVGSIIPYDDLVSTSCLVPIPNAASASTSLADRFGVYIINGRLIPEGDFNVVGLRRLIGLVGSLETALLLLPEVDESRRDSFYLPDPRFIYIIVALTEDESGLRFASSACVPAAVKSSIPCKDVEILLGERVLAINGSIQSALASNPEYASSVITENFFWVGEPSMTSRVRSNATVLNISDQTLFSAIALAQDEEVASYTIDVVKLARFIDYFGDDAEAIILGGPDNVATSVDPLDVVDVIDTVLAIRPGRVNPCGANDLSDPASQILGLIDFNKTMPDELVDCADSSIDIGDINSSINKALNAPNDAMGDLSKVFAPLVRVLDKLTSILSTIQNFINDSANLECLVGPGFSYNSGFTVGDTDLEFSSKLESITLTLQGGLEDINRFFLGFSEVLNGFSQLSCTLGFITNAFKNGAPDSPLDLTCRAVNDVALLPPCYSATLDIAAIRTNVAFRLATQSIRNVRDILIQIEQLGIELSANNMNESNLGCIASETSNLVLALKSKISSAGFS